MQSFSSLDVVFSSLDVRISSLITQHRKAESHFLFSLLFRQAKNAQSGRACAPGGNAYQKATDPPPTDGLCSFCLLSYVKPLVG